MLWLALHCPTLALDCILRRWPSGLEPALAVTDLDGSKRVVAMATASAQAGGVHAGQAVATALALLPDLVLVARDADDEARALNEAALSLASFTPIVSLRPTGVVVEIGPSLKLFGGRRALKRRLVAAMQVQGLQVATAEAPTPHAAWLLAQEVARRRARRETVRHPDVHAALDALPIAHLEHAQPYLDRFDGIGCRTLADLRRLPPKGLARRFGPALLDEIARALGERPDPQTVFEVPVRFESRIELMARVESAEALVFAARRMLAQMTGWLALRRAAVRGFTLRLHHERWTRDAIPPTEIPIALATPSDDLERLVTLVRERMDRFELKAPVLELSLVAPEVVEAREQPGTLFPERERMQETLARLVEKLSVRLGPDALSRIERVADHRPERAWREVRGEAVWAEPTAPRRTKKSTTEPFASRLPQGLGPRPAWLLAEPQPLELRANRPMFESLPLELVAGPERIEAGWWDDAPATRDYFIAENAVGRLVWVYRERLPVANGALWYLQGLFG